MSNMLEQAIIDAATLREAALKNAEQSIIEKYAPQIKKAVSEMLDDTIKETKMYKGRTVEVVHENDGDGSITVREGEGKPFVVNEAELSEASEEDILQEEEMDAAGDTMTPPPSDIVAPPAWDSRYGETENVSFTAMLDNVDEDGNIEIDLDAIELSLSQQEAAETSMVEPLGDLTAAPEEEEGLVGLGDDEEELDLGLGDLGDDEEDLQLQEIVDAIANALEEEITVDMKATKGGTIDTAIGELQYEADKQAAHDAHHDEEEDDSENEEDKSSELYETINVLKQQNKKLENIVYKLNNKLEETLLSNAKLLYQNRTINDASLNERQKSKIVEAIAKAESPKEARRLQETLKATVGSESKKGPKSLSESVNRRSNLSSMLPRRQNINESQSSDPFYAKMQKLAGIKKQ